MKDVLADIEVWGGVRVALATVAGAVSGGRLGAAAGRIHEVG